MRSAQGGKIATGLPLLAAVLLLAACKGRSAEGPTPAVSPSGAAPTTVAPTPPHSSPAPSPQQALACTDERITREQTGGLTAGYIFRPSTPATTPRPAVIAIHGGFADDQAAADRSAQRVGSNYSERLCPLGYVIFSVDYRWSAFGQEEMADVSGAFDYLKTLPDVDPSRIAVMGGSHGGYMTMMSISSPSYQRPFAAAVNLYGFVDIAQLVAREPTNPQARLTVDVLGQPEGNPAYRDISPRYLIDNLGDTPLLIIVGTKDQFIEQLRAFRDDLTKAGREFQYLEVEGAGHGFEDGQEPYTSQLWKRATEFLQENLGR